MTKRVRMDAEMLDLLVSVAERKGLTESEVLREGVRVQARMLDRQRDIAALVEAAESVPGDEGKWRPRH